VLGNFIRLLQRKEDDSKRSVRFQNENVVVYCKALVVYCKAPSATLVGSGRINQIQV
jgi:hypothetical protein